jgi:DNA-binding LacI/PurR family transcriptional regulator
MASVRQIAREAGVSITTVSRALNNDPSVHPKTRKLIIAIANRRGYAPNVGKRVTTQIGFAYTQEMTLAHPYDSAVLEGVVRGLEEQHFDLVILNLQRDKRPGESFTQFFMRKGIRGVVIRTMAATRGVCEAIAQEGFPHVVVSERFENGQVNCLDCNSLPDSRRATEYLIALGHRRIAFAMHNVPDRDHLDRFEGYQQALATQNIAFDPMLVFRQPFTLAGGATIIEMIMSLSNRPTAVFFADPLLGVGAAKKAHAMGLQIPGDLSIIGFDDTDMRFAVHPTLTAVCQDARMLGYEAALWLSRSINGAVNGEPLRKTIPTFLEINASTGPALIDQEPLTRGRDARPARRAQTGRARALTE